MNERRRNSGVIRWLKFNFVGLMGVGVQLAILAVLLRIGMTYLAATILAVEAAIVHNFLWHERYTWKDRSGSELGARISRLVKLNLSNGLVSMVGNVSIMGLLVGIWRVQPLAANTVAIGACSTINFLLGDRFVYSRT
jgi:putative flippase GtrA